MPFTEEVLISGGSADARRKLCLGALAHAAGAPSCASAPHRFDDETLPETHTCTRELHLPNYSSVAVTREKLLLALAHAGDGFYKE